MKEIFYIGMLLLPVLAFGQENGGIKFEQGRNFEQLKTEAKTENKYLFVDCYATWCGPCKQMDNEVYPLDTVGGFMNAHFISVKMQMDTSTRDGQEIKALYADAHFIRQEYKISSLPTFLLFSPDGKLVDQGVGLKTPSEFISLVKEALDPARIAYYATLDKYQQGEKDYTTMAKLALTTKDFGDSKQANLIAADYKQNFLDHADDEVLGTKENIFFITNFLDLITGSTDPYFIYFYHHPDIVVGHMNDSPVYSKLFLTGIIQKEEIDQKLYVNGKSLTLHPDWDQLSRKITTKYGKDYADQLIMSARISFYKQTNQWQQFALLVNELMKKFPPKVDGHDFANATMIGNFFQRDDWNLNSGAWDIFQYSNDKKALTIALQWSELSINLNPDFKAKGPEAEYLDTKANLLYKLKQRNEAIKTEETAYNILKKQAIKNGGKIGGDDILANLNKMKEGKSTW